MTFPRRLAVWAGGGRQTATGARVAKMNVNRIRNTLPKRPAAPRATPIQ
jgi:hypothetical protein